MEDLFASAGGLGSGACRVCCLSAWGTSDPLERNISRVCVTQHGVGLPDVKGLSLPSLPPPSDYR